MAESSQDILERTLAEQRNDHGTYVADAWNSFPVSRGDLFYIFDARGNRYMDLSAGEGVMVLGHNHISSIGGIREQMVNYEHTAGSGEHVAVFVTEYAKAISKTFPEVDGQPQQVLFCTSPEEALERAQELARAVTGIASVGTLELIDAGMVLMEKDRVSFFIERNARHGAMTIVDESHTGYGRTGMLWAHQQFGIAPDITVLGGAGGAGLPFGAVVAPRKMFARYNPPRRQFGASPAICRAGSVVLSQITPPLLEHVKDCGVTFANTAAGLCAQFPDLIVGTHGVGLAQGLVLTTEQVARRFFIEATAYGLLLRPPIGRVIPVTPPLIISENEVRHAVDLIGGICLDWTDPL